MPRASNLPDRKSSTSREFRPRYGGGSRVATVRAVSDDGTEKTFSVDVRVDTPQEVEYYRNGGILPYVLRQLAS